MTSKRDTHQENVPSLTPLFGADKKRRYLDKDVMSFGRARGCDITLDAGDVSAIHCIFYRAPAGYRIRDCGSRTGTRLNGDAVKNSLVTDGDVLQVGQFSFEIRLPEKLAAEPQIDARQIERAHQSRRNLARLALQLRRKLRRAPDSANGHPEKADGLKAKIRERAQQLDESEVELAEERARIEKDKEAHRQHVHKIESELAARLKETEEAVRAQWAAFQKRCATEEARLQELSTAAVGKGTVAGDRSHESNYSEREQKLAELEAAWARKEQADAAKHASKERELSEWEVKLKEREAECERRQQKPQKTASDVELSEREQKLKQREAAWQRKEQDLQRDCEEVDRERQEVVKLKTQAEAEQRQKQTELDRQRAAVEQAESKLRDQKTELTQMLTDLKRIQEEVKKQPRVDTKPLQQENQRLRETVAELEKRVAQASDASEVDGQLKALQVENDDLRRLLQEQLLKPAGSGEDALRKENEELRQILTEYEERLAAEIASGVSGGSSANDAPLREENEMLRQLLQEKDKLLDEIRGGAAPATGELPAEVREQMEAQASELERLKGEVVRLEQQAAEQLQKEAAAPKVPLPEDGDLESYEAELIRDRQQLEADRTALNKEIETLRSRTTELDEATREMEMEMSRERAEMARERMRLDRLRDEIKSEMERLQRDGGVRESLASFQRLREEVRAAGSRR